MEAQFAMVGKVVVVELKGRLDFETAPPFRQTCLNSLCHAEVVFDLKDLHFVGSLGLKDFVDTLGQMSEKSSGGVKMSGLSSEFRRLFESSGNQKLEFYETKEKAIESFFRKSNLDQTSHG